MENAESHANPRVKGTGQEECNVPVLLVSSMGHVLQPGNSKVDPIQLHNRRGEGRPKILSVEIGRIDAGLSQDSYQEYLRPFLSIPETLKRAFYVLQICQSLI